MTPTPKMVRFFKNHPARIANTLDQGAHPHNPNDVFTAMYLAEVGLLPSRPLRLAGEYRPVKCDNCGFHGHEDELEVRLDECEGLNERLDPGSEVPAGDCPECGAFVYLVKGN